MKTTCHLAGIHLVFLILLSSVAFSQRQMEDLGRGVVAVRHTTQSVYIGWRILGTDPDDIAFNLYRAGNEGTPVKLNQRPVSASTNWIDSNANFSLSNAYHVRPVVNGVEETPSRAFVLPANAPVRGFLEIPLRRPTGGTTPDGVSFSYSPNDTSVGDLTGDGEYEIIVKWDPSNSKDNSQSGHTGNVFLDAYQLDGTRLWRIDLGRNIRAGAHYTQFMVYDLDGDGRSEVAVKTAPGTVDGTGENVLLGNDNPDADYRNSNGYVLAGPEYLTIFDGLDGAELATTPYIPARGNVSSWGDGYGNRVDRFLAGVAYLDGQRPSLVMARGYYTRAVLAAWDWRDGELSSRWTFDSDDGTPGNLDYRGQGAHSLSVADVDGDGHDEIVYGAATIDHDGTGLYSTGLLHGDAQHVSNMDPARPGQQIFMVFESTNSNGGIGSALYDGATGEILWTTSADNDVGRGVAFDIDPRHSGFEAWASNDSSVFNVRGERIPTDSRPAYNFGVYWTDDLLRELLNQNRIDKWNWNTNRADRILTADGASSNNGTKATPALSADILGDWREEVILRSDDNTSLRIYISTIQSTRRFYTFMHDPQYRAAIAWQNTAYNQPPHPSFYIGPDMAPPPRAPIFSGDLVWKGGSRARWQNADSWLSGNLDGTFTDGNSVLFDLSGVPGAVFLDESVAPETVVVHNPLNHDYLFAGSGSLTGTMPLTKAGFGTLTIENTNAFTGPTVVEDGSLIVNGSLAGSPVTVLGRGRLGGNGIVASLEAHPRSRISPGIASGEPAAITVTENATLRGSTLEIDLAATVVEASDQLIVHGNLALQETVVVEVNLLQDSVAGGTYPIITYNGSFSGSLGNLTLGGLNLAGATLVHSPGMIALEVPEVRTADDVTWRGSDSTWDRNIAAWLHGDNPVAFLDGDRVRFTDTGLGQPAVIIAEEVLPASVEVESSGDYTFEGTGSIGGEAVLRKRGTGRLTLLQSNGFTGGVTISGGIIALGTDSGSDQTNASLGSGTVRIGNGELRFGGNAGGTVVTHDLENSLVLDSGTVTGADGRQNLNGPITATGDNLLLTQYADKDIYVAGLLSGNGLLAVDDIAGNYGEGTVHFTNGENSYGGVISVNSPSNGRAGGRISIDHTTALRHATLENHSPRADSVDFKVTSAAIGGLAGTVGFELPSDNLTFGGNGRETFFSGDLAGSGGLTKEGAGASTITGQHSYAGPTVIGEGTVEWTGSLSNSSTLDILGGATLDLRGHLILAQLTVHSGARLIGGGTIEGNVVNDGLILAEGPESGWNFIGPVANRGTFRIARGATTDGTGPFVNEGTFDLITSGGGLPEGFENQNGIVLDASSVKTPEVEFSAEVPTISIQTIPGHRYRLEQSETLDGESWQTVGNIQEGDGSRVTWTAPVDAPEISGSRFYRVIVE